MTDFVDNDIYTEYLDYLYQRVNRKYPDCTDKDTLVQETLLALLIAKHKKNIENERSYLNSILSHKYNDMLRKKYRNSIVTYDLPESLHELTEDDHGEEYERIRREIGRLINIYREVTVLYYVRNMSVAEISEKLKIPKGTVLSRLSKAREKVRDRISNMEKYSQFSYEPKSLTIGIWGGSGLDGAPFSLLSSPIEENILIHAYKKPLSMQSISDSMGIPCAYIEPIVEKLINGELMAKTSGGLVYTRCFIRSYKESLGDIPAQENLAEKYADYVWKIFYTSFEDLMHTVPYSLMTEKQRAEFLLFALNKVIHLVIQRITKNDNDIKNPLERKNGGRWVAFGTVYEKYEEVIEKYIRSGPAYFGYWDNTGKCKCRMMDFQSVFGDAHYAYRSFKYNCQPQSILRFYASFINKDIKTDNNLLYELCDDFQKLGIVRINEENGKHELDIPVLSFADWDKVEILCQKVADAFDTEYLDALKRIWLDHKYTVPDHVDIHEYYTHTDGLAVYSIAQMLAIVNKGIFPIEIKIGKTPLIVLICDKGEE